MSVLNFYKAKIELGENSATVTIPQGVFVCEKKGDTWDEATDSTGKVTIRTCSDNNNKLLFVRHVSNGIYHFYHHNNMVTRDDRVDGHIIEHSDGSRYRTYLDNNTGMYYTDRLSW